MKIALAIPALAGLSVLANGSDLPFSSMKCGEPSKEVVHLNYTGDYVPELDAEGTFQTVIRLPRGESVKEVTTGMRGIVNAEGSDIGDSVFVKVTRENVRSNIDIVTDHGNHYSFFITDRSMAAGYRAKLMYVIDVGNTDMAQNIKSPVKYVPAEMVAEAQSQATAARAEVERIRAEYDQKMQSAQAVANDTLPKETIFPYLFDRKRKPFNVEEISTNRKLTWIRMQPEEVPAVYEMKDGKPSIVTDGRYEAGLMTVGHEIEEGYLQIGAKKLSIIKKKGS